MKKFYLNIFSDIVVRDHEGVTLPDLDFARVEAVSGARDMIASDVRAGNIICQNHSIEITDGTGKVLDKIYYGDVIQILP